MSRYRRVRVPGGCYFLTLVTCNRLPLFDSAAARRVLGEALALVRRGHPFKLDAVVLLPDHLHLLVTLPAGDSDYPTRMMLLKKRFTEVWRASRGREGNNRSCGAGAKKRTALWQPRYWEHTIRTEADYATHLDYMMYNPVKHGLVERAVDWPYSSFRRLVERGIYTREWGGGADLDELFGESAGE